jgi:predicted nucleic acid-binding protein
LFTCDAVLTEAAHFLGSPAKLLEAVNRGLLVSRFDTQAAAPRLAELVEKYADRSMDFADACLVYMSEQTKDCRIATIDRADFTVYRRHGREAIPLLLPD